MFQPAPIYPAAAPMFQPAPLEAPIYDVPAIILERSPSPLELERRSPAPLLARRSSPLERGAAVMNRPVPSPAVSLQIHMNLSPSLVPCFRALALALAIYVLALAYVHVASTF
jgi:hypothetical protein